MLENYISDLDPFKDLLLLSLEVMIDSAMKKTLCLALALVFSCSVKVHAEETISNVERQALMDFKRAITDDPYGALENWVGTNHHCNWSGIVCDPTREHVISISLAKKHLSGNISPSLSNVTGLQVLDLTSNSFLGSIPREFGNLSRLVQLMLSENMLHGTIPFELGYCTSLIGLHLNNNAITGEIPSSIGYLCKLENITLNDNLLEGIIPPSIGNCSKISHLRASCNRISGEIPRGLGQLKNLKCLFLGQNKLHGEMPDELFNCSNLNLFDFHDNILIGVIKPSISKFRGLVSLDISGNSLTGPIPQVMGNLSQLMSLRVSQNNFSGFLPFELSKLSQLQGLILSDNAFEGPIPEKLFEMQQLVELDLQNNRFVGSIPDPSKLVSLSSMNLSGNMLNGSIPTSLITLTTLTTLDVSRNSLTGTLTGTIPLTKASNVNSMLMYLNLSRNQLTGPVPDALGMLTMVQVIDLSHNRISGSIPKVIERCRNSLSIDFSRNMLSGPIPGDVFTVLEYLVSLDLSQNRLSGIIPGSFGNLSVLRHVNLSFNRLQGPVPTTGVFKNISATSLGGNDALCGAKFLNPCSEKRHAGFPKKTVIIFVALFLSFIIAIILVSSLSKVIKINTANMKNNREVVCISTFSIRRFGPKELEEATDSFNEENVIGSTSLSTVYKGRLRDGTIVAIKIFKQNQLSLVSDKRFSREVRTLTKLRHSNLVKVLGYAWESQKLKALILEYMENGNLETFIHGNDGVNLSRWMLADRIDVLVSIASGLDYLHSGYDFPIVHCDLKPSNILLDQDWRAHVSDFGTARCLDVQLHIGERSLSSTFALEGTIGYMPPELAYMRKVTTKADVFSFGVVVMELMTRKRPTGLALDNGSPITLRELVERALLSGIDQLLQVIDPILASDDSDAYTGNIKELLSFSLRCTCPAPEDRPDMHEVLSLLSKLSSSLRRDHPTQNQLVAS